MPSVQIDRTPKDLPPAISHGTASAYFNHKCRCGDCCEWQSDYMRERSVRLGITKNSKGWRGESVEVDGERIKRLLDHAGKSINDFCADFDIPPTTLKRVITTGKARVATLDIIACGLGCHMSQLEVVA